MRIHIEDDFSNRRLSYNQAGALAPPYLVPTRLPHAPGADPSRMVVTALRASSPSTARRLFVPGSAPVAYRAHGRLAHPAGAVGQPRPRVRRWLLGKRHAATAQAQRATHTGRDETRGQEDRQSQTTTQARAAGRGGA
jgi:hypothetical protein